MSVETTCRSQSVRLKAQTAWLMLIMALAMCATAVGLCAAPLAAHAAAGDVPAHGKYLKDNNDGTYTIALNVKGDAEKNPQKVNVIVVFDTSSSMNTSTGNTEVTYTPTSSTGSWNYQNNLYGLIDGEYHALSRTNSGTWQNPQYHFWYNGQEYTGQRYTRAEANQSRLQAAEHAVNELAAALLAYNTQAGNDPDTVEMALVDFANMAEIAQQPTTSYSSFESVVNSRDAGNNNRGTNWEAGLRTTLNVDFDDDDPTYVIFVSDGNPTFYLQDPGNTQRGGSGQENTDNINTSYNQAVPAAQAVVNAGNEFYTIGIYGNVSRMQNLTTASGADSSHYYAADDTAALQAALAEILAKIEMAGIGNVGINDGTTSNVGTATDPIDLLEVVPNFHYYRAGGDYCSLTDTTKYDPENGLYGVEWTGSDVPQAQFTDPTVTWNIPGILENGVVYTVTFDCYPSQTTLDTIADIKNDPSSYSSLPQAIKDYIDSDGNLKTNTTASLTYTDTRTGQTNNVGYTNPDPVETQTVEEMAVSKEWNNQLEDEWDKPASITLDVTRDGDNHYSVTMSDENEWKDDVYVSIGLIKDGEALDGAHGHDFTFVEPAIESGYRWEIDVPVVHPMKIDGTVTMLILKGDAPYNNPDGTAEYTIDGKTYYVAGTGAASLTATNERRSSLNIVKAVTGVDVPEDATFPFTLNVKNALAPETAPADDPNHDSDYYVWISIWDKDQQAVTEGAVVSGATHSGGSWYYGKSGQDIVLNVKAGYSIRVNNVPVGTTYTITEGTLPTGFNFDGAAAAKTDGDDGGTTWAFTGGQTSTGSIDTTNAVYTVTYTNKYELIDINVDKVWADANNQDGIRPEELELTLNGLPAGTTAPTPEITKSEDENTWTYTWKAVPRYDAQGNEIAYTVTEGTVPEGYECTGSPANDGGTITNTHAPEVTNVTIVKEWDDSDDIGKIRPGTISAQLTADGAASGDPVELNASNQWTYTWSELPKYKDGVEIVYSADETEVPAGYDKTGPVEIESDTGVTFTVTNTYNPTPVSVDPPVQKIITGNDGLYNKGDFTFTIEATSPANAPMPENTSITNSADYELPSNPGFYEFGEITFTMPGTYAYTVKESGTVPGVTNDPDAAAGKTLTFTVEDDGTGKLTVTPTTDQVQLSFTNKYDANGEAVLEVTKAISGAPWPSGKTLTLTLAGQGGTLPATTTATLDAAGTATFGAITYGLSDAGKTYTYTITEDGFGAGWTGSPESVTATVEVKDNGDGTLGTTVTYDPSDKTITNTYEAEGEAVLEVTKAISGAPWPSGKTLTLTLAGQGGTLPATTTATLDAAGTATFGAIKYTEADAGETYTYTITEDGFGDGWTGDPTSVTATVKVTDNGDGTLATAITYDPSDKTITNTYEAEGEASFPAKKVLTIPEGFDGPEDASWTFTLTGAENAPMPATTTYTVAAGESVTFGAIAYDQSDAGKEYTYTVTESGTVAGVTNDTESSKTVKVTVKDNGDGTLTATADPADGVTFTNVYNAEPTSLTIPVKKTVTSATEGTEPADWTFTAAIAASSPSDAPMPASGGESVELSGTGNASKAGAFGEISYSKPGTYTYTVTESGTVAGITNDTAEHTVTVTVKDNGDGTLTATADSTDDAPVTLTNTYNVEPASIQIPVKKTVTSATEGTEPADWTFTAAIAASSPSDAPMPASGGESVELSGTGNASKAGAFGEISYSKPGTYTYTVTESGTVAGITNDTAEHTVTVTVKDNGDGTLTATADSTDDAPVTLTNTYNVEPVTAQIPVTKLVESEFDGSMTFDFELAAVDGAPMPGNATQSVTLTAADSKTVKFGEITYKKPGTYSYTIKETTPSGNGWTCDNEPKNVSVTVVDNKNGTMTATVTGADGEGDATTITNYYEPEGKEVSSEQEPEINIDGELVADGGILTYKIAYVNNTGKVATVKVEDNIPQYTEYVSGSAEPAAQFSGGKLTWTIENVAAGAEGFVTFKVKVNSGGAVVPIKNDAKVLVGQNESSTNSVTTTVPVKDVKNGETSIDNEGVQVGDTLTYVVSFNLAKDATSVIVTDDVPEHTTLVSGSIDNGGSLSGGTITWNLGALAAGDYTVSFKVTVDESAVTVDKIDNTAFISVNNHSDVKTNTVTNTPETGSLTISKKVVVPAGFSIDTAKAFNFKIALADKNGKDLAGEYKYSGDVSGTIANGGTITLRHNQSATIANLPAGAKYTVEETDVPAGYTAKAASVSGEIASESTVTAAFENTYSAEPTEVEKDFQAQKAVQFYDLAKLYDEQAGAGQFTFELVDKDGKVASTGTNDKDGNVSFSAITYTKPGKYVYTLREKNGGASYITYDTTEYKVTVNVVDNGDGTLTATVTPDGKSKPSFKNTYKATNKIQLSAVKFLESTIEGHTLQDGQFTFTLTGEDGAPMPAKATATNNAGGSVVFGEIVFDVSKIDEKAWVYENAEDAKQDEGKDESSEDSASAADESSDASADSAAADDSSGDTPADTSSDASADNAAADDSSGDTPADTSSDASADASADSAAADDSSGDASADTSSSTSDDETTNNGDEGANSATDTTASQDGGNADADAGKKGADAADDDAAAPAEPANAASSDEGGAAAPAAADAGDASAASGASSPMMIARAMIAMPVKLISSVFGAELTSAAAVDASAAPVADAKALDAATVKDTVTSADKSAKSAKTAAADKSAKSAAKENATKAAAEAKAGSRTATFKYTITEVNDGQPGYTYDTHAENVTVTVTDDGEGNLKVTAEYDADGAEFVNPYKAKPASVVLAATKKLEGKTLADKQFTFKLTGSDGTSETVTNAANGSVTFSKIAYKKEGTYTYTITEVNDKQQYVTYDSSKHTATVTVTDNGQGALVAEVVYDTGTTAPTFKNTYKVPPKPTPDPPKKTPKQTAKTADPFSDALAGLLAFCAISGAGVAFARRKFKR